MLQLLMFLMNADDFKTDSVEQVKQKLEHIRDRNVLEVEANNTFKKILQEEKSEFTIMNAGFLNQKDRIQAEAKQKASDRELLEREEEKARKDMLAEENTIFGKIKGDYLIQTKEQQKARIKAILESWIMYLVPSGENPVPYRHGFRVCPLAERNSLTSSKIGSIFFSATPGPDDYLDDFRGHTDKIIYSNVERYLGKIFDNGSLKGFVVHKAGEHIFNNNNFKLEVRIPGVVPTDSILVLAPASGSMCLRYIILNDSCIRDVENGLITEDVWPQVLAVVSRLKATKHLLPSLLIAMQKRNPGSSLYSEYNSLPSTAASPAGADGQSAS